MPDGGWRHVGGKGNAERAVVVLGGGGVTPAFFGEWMGRHGLEPTTAPSPDALVSSLLLGRPRAVVLDARTPGGRAATLALCQRLKALAFAAVVPVVVFTALDGAAGALAAGADEVLVPGLPEAEGLARLDALLRRSDRDTDTHPSSRLAGARAIAAELDRRVAQGAPFAAGYADLDHFKEYNDRYGFPSGDRVIRLMARLLVDAVGGRCGAHGFVGHIGGDDFLFIVPRPELEPVADLVIELFDTLIPWQYSEQDRRVGYFFGRDRRGQLHQVPLMTLSIGVVTNQHRRFTRGGEVSDLLTEMKGYAKTLPGSAWAMDRRRDLAE
jgi:diguanylate cyclase (GGDEF)-like protein